MIPEALLRGLARRRYELARARVGLGQALWALPFVGASLAGCRHTAWSIAGGALLFGVLAVLGWRGQRWGRAIAPGLQAAVAPVLVPYVMRAISGDHGCAGDCVRHCLTLCIGAGLVGGFVVGLRERGRPPLDLATAGAIAVLAGSLGCITGGLPGLLGMAAAVAVVGAPLALLVPARR